VRRAKQAAAIHHWKPWHKGGVKTVTGKAISKMNAYEHGARSAAVHRLHRLPSQIYARFKSDRPQWFDRSLPAHICEIVHRKTE